MCWVFSLKYVNIVMYLTAPGQSVAPRTNKGELREFFETVREPGRFPTWEDQGRQKLSATADEAIKKLEEKGYAEVAQEEVDELLAPLRALLADHDLFVLPAGYDPRRADLDTLRFKRFLEYCGSSSAKHALVLIPAATEGPNDRAIVDPLPAVELLATYAENWPGVLFWSRSGAATFASIQEAESLYDKLRQAFPVGPVAIDPILRGYRRPRAKRLLHLSDLHFGTDRARDNVDYLREHLLGEATKGLSRVVITGDLIDSPGGLDDPAFVAFKDFRRWLTKEVGADVLLVAGNHDQRWRGIRLLTLGDDKTSIADLDLCKVIPAPDLRCVFLGFDSSRGGDLATGAVTESQMHDRRKDLDTQCSVNRDAANYLRIALLHHHPFRYEPQKEKRVQRALPKVKWDPEKFLGLDDREAFVSWCRSNEIPIALHGHMHKTRFLPSGPEGLTAIGCGTSLGAEDLPLSYNILTIDPVSQNVGVALLSDDGRKGGFQTDETYTWTPGGEAISRAQANC